MADWLAMIQSVLSYCLPFITHFLVGALSALAAWWLHKHPPAS